MAAEDISREDAEKIASKQTKTRDEEILLLRSLIGTHLSNLPFTFENIRETLAKGHLRKRKHIQQMNLGIEANIEKDKLERAKSKRAVTDYSHRTKEFESFTALLEAAGIDYSHMCANVVGMFEAKRRLNAIVKVERPRSPARRAAFDAFNAETSGIDIAVSREQMLAVANLYFRNMHDYNLFFGCRIKDPTNERN